MAVVVLGLTGPAPVRASDDADARIDALTYTVEVLTETVRQMREDRAIPATDQELESVSGLGPAASKVYGATPGLSLGGYGEFYFDAPTADNSAARSADYHRFITYVGYKFNDRILMNTELEYEHATTGTNAAGSAGSVSVEFSYLDFLLSDDVGVRAGNLLVPMGFVNRIHEPPFFRGTFRPMVEQQIIPSTWRELGLGIHGEPASGVRYEAYVVNGFDAKRYGEKGVRDARQKGNRALFEDVGGVVSLDVDVMPELSVGGSVFSGGADQGQKFDGEDISARTTIAEAHADARHRGFRGRALVATSSIGDSRQISADVGETVPERQLGWYVEGGYNVSSVLSVPAGQAVHVWTRYEMVDLQRKVDGAASDPALDQRSLTVGVEYLPHAQVVLKADWTFQDNEAGTTTEDPLRVGAGFVF
ncbi:MAG: hypothetical protein DHS20C21_19260 [Gemmatimonadota bacterium]|nr:MAG: hypothetical protein DHS20C21_19260 [Gemmatimonadota bacterium]